MFSLYCLKHLVFCILRNSNPSAEEDYFVIRKSENWTGNWFLKLFSCQNPSIISLFHPLKLLFNVQGTLLWLMKVERKRLLNQVARLHVLFPKFFTMNKFECFRNLQNGVPLMIIFILLTSNSEIPHNYINLFLSLFLFSKFLTK